MRCVERSGRGLEICLVKNNLSFQLCPAVYLGIWRSNDSNIWSAAKVNSQKLLRSTRESRYDGSRYSAPEDGRAVHSVDGARDRRRGGGGCREGCEGGARCGRAVERARRGPTAARAGRRRCRARAGRRRQPGGYAGAGGLQGHRQASGDGDVPCRGRGGGGPPQARVRRVRRHPWPEHRRRRCVRRDGE